MPALPLMSRRSVLMLPLVVAACKRAPEPIRLSGTTMGTTYNIVAIPKGGAPGADDLQKRVDTALAQVNAQMSNWDPASEISRFNAQRSLAPVPVSAELAQVMAAAQEVHLASNGRFDTTIGPLIDLWGFGPERAHDLPPEAEIAAALARSGHGNTLHVHPDSLQKKQPDTAVNLAAIAKGYGVDAICAALTDVGITDYMVEIGGDLFASGRNADGLPWQIGVETPNALDRGIHRVVPVSGLGLASSGDYRNYFEKDGVRYSHIIDPTTGRPVTHQTASATVLAQNAMLADAWATAMLTLGREAGLKVAKAHNIAVLFIERDVASPHLSFSSTTSAAFDALTD